MSGLADLARRQAKLHEIHGLMTAMKSLALVETRKLSRALEHHQRLRAHLEQATADFLGCHPRFAVEPPPRAPTALVVIGAERGFCGGFNERILARLDALPAPAPAIVAVGQRLGAQLAGRTVAARLGGTTVAEDIPAVLDGLVGALRDLSAVLGTAPRRIRCLAHDARGEVVLSSILPLEPPTPPARDLEPILLNLAPAACFAGLLEHHLFAQFVGLLQASFAAESHQRLAHMERALDRVEDTLQRLRLRGNALRQERIVEEIEVMLASADAWTV